jgi:hypothetical protein
MGRLAAGLPERRRGGADSTDAGQAGFTAAGQASPWVAMEGPFTVMGSGGTGGTFAIDASFDGGTTSVVMARPDGSTTAYTAPCVVVQNASQEEDVMYRVRCVALSSGTMAWRISQ